MADIEITSKLTLNEGVASVSNARTAYTQTRESTLNKIHHTVQSVATSSTALSTGDVTLTEDYDVWLRNADPTNYVDVEVHKDGSNLATAFILRPGMPFGPVRCKAQSGGYPKLTLKANTAACDVEVVVGDGGDPTA